MRDSILDNPVLYQLGRSHNGSVSASPTHWDGRESTIQNEKRVQNEKMCIWGSFDVFCSKKQANAK